MSSQVYFSIFSLVAVSFFIISAGLSRLSIGINQMKKVMEVAVVFNIICAASVCGLLYLQGPVKSSFIGFKGVGFSLQLDEVSAIMFVMIALLSFVITKFSFNYLDGDQNQVSFLGRLASAFGSVQLLVLSGNLGLLFVAWVFTSISLHRLLIFYRHRTGAIIAARKKFVIARLSDISLIMAVIFTYIHFGTADLTVISEGIDQLNANALPTAVVIAGICFALAAIFKSAQFPLHGWLIEVMETPTPVSALLHAGLINAGPFLIIRLAPVFSALTAPGIMLMVIGSITAIFGSMVYLMQTSVKTTLAYSSIAHMGFSLMMCGLGAYPAAMLHLVAHSFYKAHSFLSSGNAIDVLRTTQGFGFKREGNPFKIILGLLISMAIFLMINTVFDLHPVNDFPVIFIGAVIILSLSQLFTTIVDTKLNVRLLLKACVMSVYVLASFLILETGASHLLENAAPMPVTPGIEKVMVASLILVAFSLVIGIQVSSPLLEKNEKFLAFKIHLKNGFYMNSWFDRLVGAWHISIPKIDLSHQEKLAEKTIQRRLIPAYDK